MKLTQARLRRMIRETIRENTLSRLDELYAGSAVGSYLKQGVTKLWEADNLVQRAMQEVESDQEHNLLNKVHQAIERLAFDVDEKVVQLERGVQGKKQQSKAPPPKPPSKGH